MTGARISREAADGPDARAGWRSGRAEAAAEAGQGAERSGTGRARGQTQAARRRNATQGPKRPWTEPGETMLLEAAEEARTWTGWRRGLAEAAPLAGDGSERPGRSGAWARLEVGHRPHAPKGPRRRRAHGRNASEGGKQANQQRSALEARAVEAADGPDARAGWRSGRAEAAAEAGQGAERPGTGRARGQTQAARRRDAAQEPRRPWAHERSAPTGARRRTVGPQPRRGEAARA